MKQLLFSRYLFYNKNQFLMSKIKLRKIILAVAIAAGISSTASAQQNSWSSNSQSRGTIVTDKAVARQSFPREFKLFNLDLTPLRQELLSVAGKQALKHSTIILYRMPMAMLSNLKYLKRQILNRTCRQNFLRSGLFPVKVSLINMQP